MPKIYASAYHRIAKGPMVTSIGSRSGNGIIETGIKVPKVKAREARVNRDPVQARTVAHLAAPDLAHKRPDCHCNTQSEGIWRRPFYAFDFDRHLDAARRHQRGHESESAETSNGANHRAALRRICEIDERRGRRCSGRQA